MDLALRQAAKAATRDDAMQRLRNLTIAVAIAACGALGVFAWLGAATIPGSASTTTQPSTGDSQLASSQPGNNSNRQPAGVAPAPGGGGLGMVVSGGSH